MSTQLTLVNVHIPYLTVGGLLGYSSVNSMVNLKVPYSNGEPGGQQVTEFQSMMLLSLGAPGAPLVKRFGHMVTITKTQFLTCWWVLL